MIKTKKERYFDLIARFKDFPFDNKELVNPHEIFKEFGVEHSVINPWELWHNNLDAEIMFIGQDFSDTASLRDNLKYNWAKEKDGATNWIIPTFFTILNRHFHGIDYITKNKKQKLFFTNAILGIKQSDFDDNKKEKKAMSKSVKNKWYRITLPILTELIDIVKPKYLIAMGRVAYRAIYEIYEKPREPNVIDIIAQPIELPDGKVLFIVQHCSGLGQGQRSLKHQINDWLLIRNIIDPD